MLINARDPRQWTYLRNLPKKKKKKNPGINQCGEKGGGGYYIPIGSVYLKNLELSVLGIISRIKYGYGRTYLPTQRTRRKRVWKQKKTLVLTLGSPLEKGGEKKKNPGINPGQPAGKGRGKKNCAINPGQVRRLHSEPLGKGRKLKKNNNNF
jgi:hypothetical protein